MNEIPKDLVSLCEAKGYRIRQPIGEGSFAIVYLGQNKARQSVALKCINKDILINNQKNAAKKQAISNLIINQVQIMNKINDSDNILKCFDSFESKRWKILILEYCQEGTLFNLINEKDKLSQQLSISILSQLILGFAALHKNKIIHRDLKTENILIHQKVYKIADFGTAIQLNNLLKSSQKTIVGSRCTMAPEILREQEYGIQADMWSLGVILFEMIFGQLPFRRFIEEQDIEGVHQKIDLRKISEDTKKLMKSIFVLDPEKRLKWKDLYKMYNNKIGVFKQNKMIEKQIDQSKRPKGTFWAQPDPHQKRQSVWNILRQQHQQKPKALNTNPKQKHIQPNYNASQFFHQTNFQRNEQKYQEKLSPSCDRFLVKLLQDHQIIQEIHSKIIKQIERNQILFNSFYSQSLSKRLFHFQIMVCSQLMKIISLNQMQIQKLIQLKKDNEILKQFNKFVAQLKKNYSKLTEKFYKLNQQQQLPVIGLIQKACRSIRYSSCRVSDQDMDRLEICYVPYFCTKRQHIQKTQQSARQVLQFVKMLQKKNSPSNYQKAYDIMIKIQSFLHSSYVKLLEQWSNRN